MAHIPKRNKLFIRRHYDEINQLPARKFFIEQYSNLPLLLFLLFVESTTVVKLERKARRKGIYTYPL